MSALGGILTFDREHVDRARLACLGRGLERLGPDGGREVIAGPVGMTYRAFHTNAESRRERQPYCLGHRAMLCFDGRLDNRDELLFQLRDDLRGDDTDVALAMAAYLRWGHEGIARLVGDFALALWDRRDRAVWLARDCVGSRTLYYHVDNNRLIWSTDLSVLLDMPGVPVDVNDEYVAGFLACGPELHCTPYRAIHAVRPAHVLRVDQDALTSEHRIWDLEASREIRYQSDAEYEEHFRATFQDAVGARLRSDRTVFSELSGGLDSSSIVCMAHHVLHTRGAPASALETVSYIFDNAPTADEQRWIAHVDQWRGSSGHRVSARTYPHFVPPSDTSAIALPNGFLASSAYALAVRAAMRERGARVLFSGIGGDELLHSTNNPMPELSDLVASRQVRQLHRRLKVWSALLARPYVHLLWNDAIVPNLPLSIRARVHSGAVALIPDWLDARFVKRMHIRERMAEPVDFQALQTPSARLQARNFQVASRAVAAGFCQEIGGCDITFPLLDRRLVEFVQAIPFSQKIRPGQSRSILRRALRGIVPEPVLHRRGKGGPAEVSFRALAREADALRRLLSDARVCARGYVHRTKFTDAFERAAAGREYYSGKLMTVLTLELWLRAVERRLAPHPNIAADGERAAGSVTMPCEAKLSM